MEVTWLAFASYLEAHELQVVGILSPFISGILNHPILHDQNDSCGVPFL